MTLITPEQMQQLLKNGSPEFFHDDHYPVVRLHTPDDKFVWLLTKANPKNHDWVAGFFNFGPGIPFIGKVQLSEINKLPNKIGMSYQADESFVAEHPISFYIESAFLDFIVNSKNISGAIWEEIDKQLQKTNSLKP